MKKHPLLLYMAVGGIATLLDTMILVLLVRLTGCDYRIASLLGCVVGIFINFVLCDYFIFDRQTSFAKACAKHYIASSFGLVLNQIGMIILISGLACKNLILARLIVATCTFLANYFLIKTFVFGKN